MVVQDAAWIHMNLESLVQGIFYFSGHDLSQAEFRNGAAQDPPPDADVRLADNDPRD